MNLRLDKVPLNLFFNGCDQLSAEQDILQMVKKD